MSARERPNRGIYPHGSLHYETGRRKTKEQERRERREEDAQAKRAALAAWIMSTQTEYIERLRKGKR